MFSRYAMIEHKLNVRQSREGCRAHALSVSYRLKGRQYTIQPLSYTIQYKLVTHFGYFPLNTTVKQTGIKIFGDQTAIKAAYNMFNQFRVVSYFKCRVITYCVSFVCSCFCCVKPKYVSYYVVIEYQLVYLSNI